MRYFATATHKRRSTRAHDETVIAKHALPLLGSLPLRSITPLDVQAVVNKMTANLKPRTVRTDYGVLRAVLNAAVQSDLITASPCRGIRLPAIEHEPPEFLEWSDLDRLARELPDRYAAIVYVGGVLRLRWSEVAGLRVGRINFLRRSIEISETISEVNGRIEVADVKTRSSRQTIRVPHFVIAALSEHLREFGSTDPDAYVFSSSTGEPLRASNFRERVWRPATLRAGLEGLTFHRLRHAAVGFMIEADAHIETIKQRLGHSSIRVTSDVYGSVLPSVEDGVTERLDDLFSRPRGADVVQTAGR